MSNYNPDSVSPPGDTIADILDEKRLSSDYLASHLGLTPRQMFRLLLGKIEITPGMAQVLSDVLGSSPQFWLERERQYRESVKSPLSAFQRLTIHLITLKAVPADGTIADGINFLMDAKGIANTAEACIEQAKDYCQRVRVELGVEASDEEIAGEIMQRIERMKNEKTS